MEYLLKLKLKVAIGKFGGGCVVDVIEIEDNHFKFRALADLDEYGAYLDDLFHNGEELPVQPGVYIFDGRAVGSPYSTDDAYQYHGTFKPN